MTRTGVTHALVVSALATGAIYLLLPILGAFAGPSLATRLMLVALTAVYALSVCDRQGLPRRRTIWPLVLASVIALLATTPGAALVPLLAALAYVRNPPTARAPVTSCLLRELGLLGTGLLVAASLHTGSRETLCLAIYAFLLIQLLGETLLGAPTTAVRDSFERAQRRLERRLRAV